MNTFTGVFVNLLVLMFIFVPVTSILAGLDKPVSDQGIAKLHELSSNIRQRERKLDHDLRIMKNEIQQLSNTMGTLDKKVSILLEYGRHPYTETTTSVPGQTNIRLAGSLIHGEGRVEVFHDGIWGTICDDHWGDEEAKVVCRMLGLEDGIHRTGASYGAGVEPTWLDNVSCVGSETSLFDCGYNGWGIENCGHSEDAGVKCTVPRKLEVTVRLVGPYLYSGLIEVNHDGQWGTVCGDSWDDKDASVVCFQLGFGNGTAIIDGSYGHGSEPIWLDDVACTGSEARLEYCSHNGWGIEDCSHSEDAGVKCIDRIRLVGTTTSYAGRVEIFHDNEWGTICDANWDLLEVGVICRMLRYTNGGRIGKFGYGNGPIWLDDVSCSGLEMTIGLCGHGGWGNGNCDHSNDVGVICNTDDHEDLIRLVGSSTSFSGRVEIFHDNEWGTICDHGWGELEVNVVCRMLGYTNSGRVGTFGNGTGPIWLDDVSCSGLEMTIGLCGHGGWGNGKCHSSKDVGVICNTDDHEVRLVGPDQYSGRVEVHHYGQWGTVCDDSWDDKDASVVCIQLGFGNGTAIIDGTFGHGSEPTWLDGVACTGSEARLEDCSHNDWGIEDCSHSEDAGVICSDLIRLVGSNTSYAGRVEIFHDNEWGTICDDNWDLLEVGVICRMLGYTNGGRVGKFGYGTGPIWLDNVSCSGLETTIRLCGHGGWGNGNCDHSKDVGVICNTDEHEVTVCLDGPDIYSGLIEVHHDGHCRTVCDDSWDDKGCQSYVYSTGIENLLRLVGSSTSNSGRVEIFHDNEWGTICDHGWDELEVDVVCRMLGYTNGGRVETFGNGTGQIWFDDVSCSGLEMTIRLCGHRGWGTGNCEHAEDVGVVCNTDDHEVRLVGPDQSSGRVEVHHDGQWGTICNDSWDDKDAIVVCIQLGFGNGTAIIDGSYGHGSEPTWLDEVDCTGSEARLEDCSHNGWGIEDCSHSEDAGVICSDLLRLVGSSRSNSGRLEIFHDNEWGTICDHGWDEMEVSVVCRMLGYTNGGRVCKFGYGTGPIWLDDVSCSGLEPTIRQCGHGGWGNGNGDHSKDVGVICNTDEHEVCLVGPDQYSGRVEVHHYGQWGTVCDDSWEDIDASVVCIQLGFGDGTAIIDGSYGPGSEPIWLDDVECTGSEARLEECSHNGWGIEDCSHSEDAGVRCSDRIRLVGTTTSYAGRVEIFHDNEWGTICDHNWDFWEVAVICRMLGYTNGGRVGKFGYGTGPIWLDDVSCSGLEMTIGLCRHGGWGNGNSHHSKDVGVICNTDDHKVTVFLVGRDIYSRLIEVHQYGQWRTVCYDSWDDKDASVVCIQLGLNGGRVGTFGSGTGPIWLDDVSCSGLEMTIRLCGHRGWGFENCEHAEDVGVVCNTDDHEVRLVGTDHYSGRVEVHHYGQWGAICDDSWDDKDASVVCTQLGFGNGTAISGRSFGPGSEPTWLDDVACNGSEARLEDCSHNGWGIEDCSHREDAGVICIDLIRLVGSSTSYAGRVEIFHDNEWGTICDDDWDVLEVDLVCRMLGYTNGGRVGKFGYGTGPIWLDDVSCSGLEMTIGLCGHDRWGNGNCHHSNDVGVICNTDDHKDLIRLVGSNTSNSGRVEIFHDNEWGTICDDGWDELEVDVVCRMLDYTNGGSVGTFGYGTGPIWLDDVSCSGLEMTIRLCGHRGWGTENCEHAEDVGVVCNTDEHAVRLVGPGQYSGRVEVHHDGQWGTVCYDSWDDKDASVVCIQLGFGNGTAITDGSFGPGSEPTWLDDVACTGSEARLEECNHNGWGQEDCSHSEDAGARCIDRIRLVGTTTSYAGRVEIFHDNEWGSICDADWDELEVDVVCRMLGYTNGGRVGKFVYGTGPIWLDDVSCSGLEMTIGLCGHGGWGNENCDHSKDVGVVCNTDDHEAGCDTRFLCDEVVCIDYSQICDGFYNCRDGTDEESCFLEVYLIGGVDDHIGRVVVNRNGIEGSICGEGWDDRDANVICKMAGYSGGIADFSGSYGPGDGPVWLSNVQCTDTETDIGDCIKDGWASNDCDHSDDAAARCFLEDY